MRRLFFSTSVARPAVQQLAAMTGPVHVPVSCHPAHAPECNTTGGVCAGVVQELSGQRPAAMLERPT